MNQNQPEFYPSAINASDCISNGWNMVKQNYGLYLGITLVAMLINCVPCVSLFIAGPITAGLYYCYLRGIRGEPIEFGMMFKGFENFVPAMVVGLIAAIPEVIGQIFRVGFQVAGETMKNGGRNGRGDGMELLAGGFLIAAVVIGLVFTIGTIILRVSLYFAIPLIMDKKLGVMDAIKLSARAAWKNIGGIILLAILEGLIALAGVLALCIGVLFVMPILFAANAFAYRQVFPDTQQNFQNVPPPPNAYGGGSFGYGQ